MEEKHWNRGHLYGHYTWSVCFDKVGSISLTGVGFFLRILMIHYFIDSLYKIKRSCFDYVTFDQIGHIAIFEIDNLTGTILRKEKSLSLFIRISRDSIIINHMEIGCFIHFARPIIYFSFEPGIPELFTSYQ